MTFSNVLLGDVVEEITVGHVGPMASEYVPQGTPFLRSLNVEPYKIATADLKFIEPEFHARLRKSALKPGDVVIVRTGKPGTCAVIPTWLDKSNCSDLVIVRCGSKIIPNYLSYWVNSSARHHIGSNLVGAVQQHFNVGAARQMPIYLPSIEEQETILSVLCPLDDKIELNRRTNETLEAMAQAIFRDWFVDFGPVRRKLAGATDPVEIMGGLTHDPERAAKLAALFPETIGEDEMPSGWRRSDLSELATVNDESWRASDHPDAVDYVDLSNTKWGSIGSSAKLSWAEAPTRARRVVQPLDTIIGTVRPGNGSYAFISEEGYTASTGFAVLRPRRPEYADALYVAATRPETIERLANLAEAHAGAYPSINPEDVLAVEFITSTSELLLMFSLQARPMRERIEQAKSESRTLAETRDYLLPRLMSGAVRVGDIADEAAA